MAINIAHWQVRNARGKQGKAKREMIVLFIFTPLRSHVIFENICCYKRMHGALTPMHQPHRTGMSADCNIAHLRGVCGLA